MTWLKQISGRAAALMRRPALPPLMPSSSWGAPQRHVASHDLTVIALLERILADKERILAEKDKFMERTVADKERILAEKDKFMERTVADKERILASQEARVCDKERQLVSLAAQLQSIKGELGRRSLYELGLRALHAELIAPNAATLKAKFPQNFPAAFNPSSVEAWVVRHAETLRTMHPNSKYLCCMKNASGLFAVLSNDVHGRSLNVSALLEPDSALSSEHNAVLSCMCAELGLRP
jgi:hypothetical protein